MSSHDPSYFHEQRDLLLQDIHAVRPLPPSRPHGAPLTRAQSLEAVLQNVNKLNRSIEGVNAVGSEFHSVEALWSNFEALMGRRPDPAEKKDETAEHSAEGAR